MLCLGTTLLNLLSGLGYVMAAVLSPSPLAQVPSFPAPHPHPRSDAFLLLSFHTKSDFPASDPSKPVALETGVSCSY
jgi:hypothetical protein